MDRAATVIVPVTSPAADTVPFPVTWRKMPLTGRSPQTLLFFSRTSDLGPSAASGNVCPGDDAPESFVVGVVVAPDDVPADHAGLLLGGWRGLLRH